MATTQRDPHPTDAEDAAPTARLPGVVYALAAGIFLVGTTEFVIAGLLGSLSDDLGVTVSTGGLLITAFALGMVVGAPAMAAATLHLPRRATLGAALVVFAVGHVLAATTSSFPVMLGARVVTALATGAFWAVAAVVASRAVGPGRKARALGIMIGGLTIANVVGVPLGTWLGEAIGWRPLFWVLAVAAVLAALVVLPLVPSARADEPRPDLRAEVRAFRDVHLLLALATIAARQAGLFGTFSYVAPLLTERAGLAVAHVPVGLALFGLGAFVGTQVGGRLGDTHPWPVLFGGLTATAVVMLALGLLATTPPVALALLALLGFVSFTVDPTLNARVIGRAGDAPTLASATTTSAFNVGNAVGPWLGGIVLTVSTGAPPLMGVAFVVLAIAVAGLARHLVRRDGHAHPDVAR